MCQRKDNKGLLKERQESRVKNMHTFFVISVLYNTNIMSEHWTVLSVTGLHCYLAIPKGIQGCIMENRFSIDTFSQYAT